MRSFTKQNKVVIEYSKRKQGILLKTNYCGCETLGENKEQNRFYRKEEITLYLTLFQESCSTTDQNIALRWSRILLNHRAVFCRLIHWSINKKVFFISRFHCFFSFGIFQVRFLENTSS